MAHPSIGSIVAESWNRATTLASYGMKPLTVAWYDGQAFVYVWNWRNGLYTWKPMQTTRQEPPPPTQGFPFASDWMFTKLDSLCRKLDRA